MFDPDSLLDNRIHDPAVEIIPRVVVEEEDDDIIHMNPPG